MARLLNGTTQYLHYAGAPVSAPPLSFSAWVYQPVAVAVNLIMGITNNATGVGFWLSRSALAAIQAVTGDGAIAPFASFGPLTANQWVHVAGVWVSNVSRQSFGEGTASLVETTACTPGAVSVTDIGVFNPGVGGTFFLAGRVSDVAIYNIALTQDDVTSLANGASPLEVRPSGLVDYWPLGFSSPEADLIGRRELTLVAAPTVIAGPRLMVPQGLHIPPQLPYRADPTALWKGPNPYRLARVPAEYRRRKG